MESYGHLLAILLVVFAMPCRVFSQGMGQSGVDWDVPTAPRSGSGRTAGTREWLEDLPVEADSVIMDYERPYDLDLSLGGSYLYDSNTYLTPNHEVSTMTGVIDLGAAISRARNRGSGLDYGIDYSAQYFIYEDALAQGGRDPYEQRLGAFVGLNAPKTSLRVFGDVYDNNANSIDFSNFDHEVRRSSSLDSELGLNLTRRLDHGSIEVNGAWSYRDFSPSLFGQLNDSESLSGNVYWFYDPAWASKTSFGLGVGGGRDDTENNFRQTYIEPGIQIRYRATDRTQGFVQVGYNMRDYSGDGSRSGKDTVVGGIGVIWNPRETTQLRLSANHSVYPSLATIEEDYTSTGFAALLTQRLPAELVLTVMAAYDLSDYFATGYETPSGREDEFLRVGGSLGRQFHLFTNIASSVSVFYYFNSNDSSFDSLDFSQQVAGLRVGLSY